MSYDLTLIALGEGEGIDEIFARMESEEPQALPSAEMRTAFSTIAEQLGVEGYEYLESDSYVTIVNENLGAVMDLREEGAEINVAYWHSGAEATAAMESIVNLVGRVRELTGWTLFDPQSGEIVTDLEMLRSAASSEMDRTSRWASKNIAGPTKRPWWRFWG